MDEIELIDPEELGILIDGLTVNQVRMLKKFYQFRSGDTGLSMLEDATKNI